MSTAKRSIEEEMERTCSKCGADITQNQWNLCTDCYASHYSDGPRSILNRLFDIREELEAMELTEGDSLYQLVNAAINVASIKQQDGIIPAQKYAPEEETAFLF